MGWTDLDDLMECCCAAQVEKKYETLVLLCILHFLISMLLVSVVKFYVIIKCLKFLGQTFEVDLEDIK